jgi:hypothetical protein
MNYCKIINKIKKYYYSAIREKFRKSHNVPCSVCGQPLVRGLARSYETLNEHVTDPNMEGYESKPTLICDNENCRAHNTGFWSEREDGDWFAFAINSNEKYSKYVHCPRLITSFYLGIIDMKNYNRKGIYIGKNEY